MNLLDLVLAVLLVSALSAGYRIGFVARAATWVGVVAGFVLTLRLLPTVLRDFGAVAPVVRLLATLIILLVGAAVGGAIGEAFGFHLRRAVPPGARVLDRTGGAVAGVIGALVALWLFLPIAAQVPGAAASQVRNSEILLRLEDLTPRAPEAAQEVRSLVAAARFPEVFDDLRPAPEVGPVPTDVPVASGVGRSGRPFNCQRGELRLRGAP